MQIADTGSKDLAFQWESLLPTDNIKDWIFQSTPYSGSINSYALFGVYTIAYTGGTTYAGEANEDFRYQRPALYIFDNYGKYHSSNNMQSNGIRSNGEEKVDKRLRDSVKMAGWNFMHKGNLF